MRFCGGIVLLGPEDGFLEVAQEMGSGGRLVSGLRLIAIIV